METHRRFEKKLASWLGKLLSYGDRLVLINSVLTSLPMFLLSFFAIPIGYGKGLISIGHVSFGKVMNTKRNTDLLDGTLFIDQRTKGV
jgi:hypothetical protein